MGVSNQERTMSHFHMYSVGVAAENKKRGTDYLEVSPLEQLPMMDGQLTQNTNDYRAASSDSVGMAYEENNKITATVLAKWKPVNGGGNRMTSPDVRRGEKVMLYQFADSDEYYWDTMSNEIGNRKLETVAWAYSGTQDENDSDANPDNSYVLELSTHEGRVGLTTSQKNGEKTKYTVCFNSKEGIIDIKDSHGNGVYINTSDSHVKQYNSSGSIIEMIGKVINISCDDTINMKCSTMNVTTSNINVKGERVHQGNSVHQGNVAIQGGLSGSAGAGGGGGATFTGGVDCQQDVTAGGISLMSHTHSGDSGGSTSGPR